MVRCLGIEYSPLLPDRVLDLPLDLDRDRDLDLDLERVLDLDRVFDLLYDLDRVRDLPREGLEDFLCGVESLDLDLVLDLDLYRFLVRFSPVGTVWSGVDSLLPDGLMVGERGLRPLSISSFFCLIANCFSRPHS